jgi:hypothetical protein
MTHLMPRAPGAGSRGSAARPCPTACRRS